MSDNELRELVEKYNNSNIFVSIYYGILLWWNYGSIAEATRINARNIYQEEKRQEQLKNLSPDVEEAIRDFATSRQTRERTMREHYKNTKILKSPNRRPNYYENDDDDDIDIMTPIIIGSMLSPSGDAEDGGFTGDDGFSGFGGAEPDNFSGAGAGGSWTEDSTTVSGEIGGSFDIS